MGICGHINSYQLIFGAPQKSESALEFPSVTVLVCNEMLVGPCAGEILLEHRSDHPFVGSEQVGVGR